MKTFPPDLYAAALLAAHIYHDAEMEAALRKAEADIETPADELDSCVLHLAAERGYTALVDVLAKAGTEIDAKNHYGQTALMWAADSGQLEVVELLVKSGANLDTKDNIGQTVLMFAARNGHLDVVKFLMESDFDLEAKDSSGWTALTCAALNGKLDVVKFLEQAKTSSPIYACEPTL